MRREVAFIFLTMLLIPLPGCSSAEAKGDGKWPDHVYLLFETDEGPLGIRAEVAETMEEKMTGLMYRETLPYYHGMLFVFDEPLIAAFWMKNVEFPLDLVYIGKDWRIKQIEHLAMPCEQEPCEHYYSDMEVSYVLEVNGGFMEEHGLYPGARIEVVR